MMSKKDSTGVDLDTLATSVRDQEAGRAVDILIAGQAIGLTIVVAGQDSERYRKAWRAEVKALVEAGSLDAMTAEDDDAMKRRVAAGAVISWSPDPVLGGEARPCTRENALMAFNAIPAIFDQCYGAMLDREGFTKR
ncbi:MAG TPA: hypothetical protein VFT69_17150 [Pseudolabrys sp.]|nr:hypothetical protein [Pseudolabrys sp.]